VRPPKLCQACGSKPVARKTVRFCYDCQPGGPVPPPPCRRCGSTDNYFTAGLCAWCHRGGFPGRIESCRDCHAWGVTRTHSWLCSACHGWRAASPGVGGCQVCAGQRHLGRGQFCRLCWRTAATIHNANRRIGSQYQPLDVKTANRGGQQLFFANMAKSPRPRGAPAGEPVGVSAARPARGLHFRQLLLFDSAPPSWTRRHGIGEPLDYTFAALLDEHAKAVAASRGWSLTATKRVRLALKVLLGMQGNTPRRTVRGSEVRQLAAIGLHGAALVRIVLADAGVFENDEPPAIQAWFTRTVEALPTPMQTELRTWFDIQHNGSDTPPRTRPRAEVTIRVRLGWAMPTLQAWAAAGRTSLREISRDDVLAALPTSGTPRATVGAGLKSIFRTLKAQKLLFTNPTARINIGQIERRQPLPADLTEIRRMLNSADPATAALAGMLAFHGLRAAQIRNLHLGDARDGRLHVDGRVVLLAAPVRDRLGAYLDFRASRWPRTVNPHLFINHRTAMRTDPVGPRWLGLKLGVAPRVLREDRILDETLATGGDIRRLCDLFGISVGAASRFAATLDHPDLAGVHHTEHGVSS
jgi:hypothetical protein